MAERTHSVAVCDSAIDELEAWIEAARHGDREALGRALSAVRDYLLLVANERLEPALKAKGNASDLVQETFLLAQRGVDRFRGRTASEWRHWLRSILIRNMAQERRRFAATAKRQVQREVADTRGDAPRIPRLHRNSQSPFGPARARGGRDRGIGPSAGSLSGSRRLAPTRGSFIRGDRPARGISAEAARKLWTRALARLTEGTWSSP